MNITKAQRNSTITALKRIYPNKTSIKLEIYIHEFVISLEKTRSGTLQELYAKYAFEKVGQLLQYPGLKKDILRDMKKENVSWDSCVYSTWKKKEEKDTADCAAGMKITKGEFKCNSKKCRSDECYYYQSQSRSADEGFTTHVVCSKCGSRYSFN